MERWESGEIILARLGLRFQKRAQICTPVVASTPHAAIAVQSFCDVMAFNSRRAHQADPDGVPQMFVALQVFDPRL
jgi:hypothetical protein